MCGRTATQSWARLAGATARREAAKAAAGCGRWIGSDGGARGVAGGAQADRRTGTQGGAAGTGTGFFRRSLAAHKSGREAICKLIADRAEQGGLCVERMCELSGVSRTGFYRHWEVSAPRRADTGIARYHPASGRGQAVLRVSTGAAGTAAAWAPGECQAGAALDARRQSTLPAHATVCACDH
jgi:hypothetical protein